MMISTKGRYALQVMLDLAQQSPDAYISLHDISQRQAVIFMYLISAGLCLTAVLLTEMEGIYAIALLVFLLAVIFIGARKIGILQDRS